MKIARFLTEEWMNDYERQAKYNLTDTSCESLTMQDLLKLDPHALDDVTLDYGWITGLSELRNEILSMYQNQDEKTLALTHGALQANELAMNLVLNPGDHVITIKPGYQQFSDYPRFLGCTATEIELNPSDWSLSMDTLAKAILPETRMILFANPSNPTGTWLDRTQLEQLVDLCKEQGIWILLDEVYRNPLYPDQEAAISDLYDKGISTSSLSKIYGCAGLRFGWMKACPELIARVHSMRDYMLISTGPLVEQMAFVVLQNRQSIIENVQKVVAENKAILNKWLESTPYFKLNMPEKGTVSFLQLPEGTGSTKFAVDLLEKTGIFFVPGSTFGMDGYVRLGLAKKHDDLASILQRLDKFTQQWLEKNGKEDAQK